MYPLRKRKVKIGCLVVAIVTHSIFGPRDATLHTKLHSVSRNACFIDDAVDCIDQHAVACDSDIGSFWRAHIAKNRNCCCHAQRVAVVRAEVHNFAFGN